MRITPCSISLLSAILCLRVTAQEAVHWDFEQPVAPKEFISVKDKSGKHELLQTDVYASPTASPLVRPSASDTVQNKQSAVFYYYNRQYLHAASAASLNVGPDAAFTLELWIHPRSYSESDASTVSATLVQKRGGAPTDPRKPGYQLAINSEGKLIFRAEGKDSGAKTLVSNATAPLDKWTHVAVTRDTSGLFRLYINGQLDLTAGGPRFPGSLENDAEFQVGASRFVQHRTGFFDGQIDDLRLSPEELTPGTFLLQ